MGNPWQNRFLFVIFTEKLKCDKQKVHDAFDLPILSVLLYDKLTKQSDDFGPVQPPAQKR